MIRIIRSCRSRGNIATREIMCLLSAKENTVSMNFKHLRIADIVLKYAEYRVEFSNGEK